MIVKKKEINKIISKYNLSIHNDIYHFRFNSIFWSDSFSLIKKNDKIILYDNKVYDYAPALVFSNFKGPLNHKINNSIDVGYNKFNKNQRKIFWFLKLNGLNDYLKRRTLITKNPSKHFPTLKNFYKISDKINGNIHIKDLDISDFNFKYNQLKRDHYIEGREIYFNLINRYPNFPKDWIKSVELVDENENLLAIAMVVDDKVSISLENISSKRSNLSYGIYLCTKIIDIYSNKNYRHFDAGISNIYGVYKDKIFLDSKEVIIKKTSILKRITNLLEIFFKK